PVMGRLCKIKNCPSFMHHSISWGLPAACSIFHATCAKATNWSSVSAGRALSVQAGPASARPAPTDDQLVALAHVAWNIEQAAGRPQDIEWCMKEGQFFILQSRPITGFSDATNKIIEDIKQEVAEREPHAYWQISNNIGRIPLVPFAQSVWSTTGAACERASETLALRALNTWSIFNDYIYVGERHVPNTNET